MEFAKRLEIDVGIEFPGFLLQVDQTVVIDGVLGLFGPSGAGKSTFLRILAGLEASAAGRLEFEGEVWQDSSERIFVKSFKRAVGCVFQNPQLFPHMSVTGNLKYGHRRRRGRRSTELGEVLRALDLDPLLTKPVEALSGGEKQRVAIGRALLSAPRLMLLDEPLAALDDTRKSEILPYLERIVGEFGIPSIYVSHSVYEVQALSNDAWLLENGKIVGRGLSKLPNNCGPEIELGAVVVGERNSGHLVCKIGNDEILARGPRDFPAGMPVKLLLAKNCVSFAFDECPGMPKAGAISGVVTSVEHGGILEEIRVEIETKGGKIELRVPIDNVGGTDVGIGQRAFAIALSVPLASER